MKMQPNFQLALELSNVFPLGEVVKSSFQAAVRFARDLQNSGSDIIVEEDLAVIFGRGRADAEIVEKFKKDVLKSASLVPLYKNCEIGLDTRPGPTVNRAIQHKDRGYLSTVIQLSMLGWMQDREGLAVALVEGMAKRYRMNLPNTTPAPDVERVKGALAACSSQTSVFSWDWYRQSVENRIRERNCYGTKDHPGLVAITPTTLLAAMDYLYLAQSLPEDRKVTISNQKGLITLIIWAHHILNLVVAVNGCSGGGLTFGDGPPSVIIQWTPDANFWTLTDPEVCLLDSEVKVVLKTEPDMFRSGMLEAYERHPLQGLGTTYLRRCFSVYTTALRGNPLCTEAAQWIISLALLCSKKLYYGGPLRPNKYNNLNLDRWRIIASARIVFHDIDFDEDTINTYISKTAEWLPPAQSTMPRGIQLWQERLDANGETLRVAEMTDLLNHLIGIILIFAFVVGIEHCAQLPLILNPSSNTSKPFSSIDLHRTNLRLDLIEEDIFFAIARMLVGNKFIHEETVRGNTVFLVSDFGWSVFLSTIGDDDPATIRPELIHVKPGTPANALTGERKFRLRDSQDANWDDAPYAEIVDRGTSYQPRSTLRTDSRVE